MTKIICSGCYEQLGKTHFEDSDGAMSFPVCFFPTIKDVREYYKDLVGETYFYSTGKKAKDTFYKSIVSLTHLGVDDDTDDDGKVHTFGKVECWVDC